jgi:hypothetical protein
MPPFYACFVKIGVEKLGVDFLALFCFVFPLAPELAKKQKRYIILGVAPLSPTLTLCSLSGLSDAKGV